ncbi:class I tRNA ligase family protein [Methylobacterium sp. SyP6R]|uniref:class I tRNA ligase family protein n=1 Tax=Methylobacterium sp. SyP6R TaxID=2718876 RepID=UPI001F0026A3|nr:class I tRNA ligase family protein [Methylobacterium sp. SyP6R]MCF4130071.1 class I tRNA ligase family protein [Methylobacterium sp. SyP6R]
MTYPQTELFAIVAPPPTPNGDLHVGHLSGPYFGADVLRRYLSLRGHKAVAALGVDTHQSYVVTTAERLGLDPRTLATRSHAEISSTLRSAEIAFDVVGLPDASYAHYVVEWFRHLDGHGVFSRRQRPVPYDVARDRFLFEAYASGRCPTCLCETKGNICETCGHPNDAEALFGLHPTGGRPGDRIEPRTVSEVVFDLETWRPRLRSHLLDTLPERRPTLARLIDELFDSRLPTFPITFPSMWGVASPLGDERGMVLNVWAEMVPGHYYWLDKAHRTKYGSGLFPAPSRVRYIQYLGFDNSFFYCVAQLCLAFAAAECGADALLPAAFVTNEFYLLDQFKFSTSQGHLIWGRDFLAKVDADEARFYLAYSNPEYNQANFSQDDFELIVARKFRKPLEALEEALLALNPPASARPETPEARALRRRFEAAYGHERPSLRIAALAVATGLELALALVAHDGDPDVVRGVVRALCAGMAPIVPAASERLWLACGETGPVTWPTPLASIAASEII